MTNQEEPNEHLHDTRRENVLYLFVCQSYGKNIIRPWQFQGEKKGQPWYVLNYYTVEKVEVKYINN